MRRRNLYGNIKTTLDGIEFDSRAEAARYAELKLLEQAGQINNLKTQVEILLEVRGVKVCKYIADFTYNELTEAGTHKQYVVEDVKGVRTAVFNLKARLFKAIYGYPITIVYSKGKFRRKRRKA